MQDAERETHLILVQSLALGDGDGLTVAVKDCLDIAGYPTRCGSRLFAAAAPAARHATVVEAVLAAGCRILGKANMHELAYGVTGINAWTGTPPNPRYPERVPGGSSSGSAAAVAAGLVDFALGTDTGGSIRMPATCCGVYGLKPTFGRISRNGATPCESSLDCVGPIAIDMATLQRAMTIIDTDFRIAVPPKRATLGIVSVESDPRIAATVVATLAATGLELRPVELPSLKDAYEAGLTLIGAEMFSAFGAHCGSGLIGPDVEARLTAAGNITSEQRMAAEAVRRRFAAEVDAVLQRVDALALPALPIVPPTIEEATDARAVLPLTRLLRPFNLSGHPALTIPLQTADDFPAGLQLVGAMHGDEALCALGILIERALQ